MTSGPEFIDICNEYRQNDSTGAAVVFADTVQQRLEESCLPSEIFLEDFDDKESIISRLNAYKNNNGGDLMKNFFQHKEGFERFLKHFNTHISAGNSRHFKNCETPETCTSRECSNYNEEYLMYHTYVILACKACLDADEGDKWKSVSDFVINVANRSYRLPLTSRYLTSIWDALNNFQVKTWDLNTYHDLREVIKQHTS